MSIIFSCLPCFLCKWSNLTSIYTFSIGGQKENALNLEMYLRQASRPGVQSFRFRWDLYRPRCQVYITVWRVIIKHFINLWSGQIFWSKRYEKIKEHVRFQNGVVFVSPVCFQEKTICWRHDEQKTIVFSYHSTRWFNHHPALLQNYCWWKKSCTSR